MSREKAEQLPRFLYVQWDEPSNGLTPLCDGYHLVCPAHLVDQRKALGLELPGWNCHITPARDHGHMTMVAFAACGVKLRSLQRPSSDELPGISCSADDAEPSGKQAQNAQRADGVQGHQRLKLAPDKGTCDREQSVRAREAAV